MGKIIDIRKHIDKTMNRTDRIPIMYEELIKKIKKHNRNKHEYSMLEINDIAIDIINTLDYYPIDGAIPIVKIAKTFDFVTYKESLKDNLSGDISINGDTEKEYGNNRVILVNKHDDLFHQRFVVAHELAHYLFDFLGNKKYADLNKRFSDTYYKDMHDTVSEIRANKFAASILMPEDVFIKQYLIAKNIDKDRMFVIMYLSRFFETTMNSIERRIAEVLL